MPDFVDPEVLEVADSILQRKLGITRKSITAQNCLQIFKLLINCFS